jgi:hypothetical protein
MKRRSRKLEFGSSWTYPPFDNQPNRTLTQQLITKRLPQLFVQVQQTNCSSSDRSQSYNLHPLRYRPILLQLEVLCPRVLAWMKEACDFPGFGIDARQVGAFLQIALPAGERQIIKMRGPAVLFGNNVLDMERAAKESLRQ